MKTILFYISTSTILLCASLCSCPEETEYVQFNATQADLISIDDDQQVYAKNDILWITIDIPNVIEDDAGNIQNINQLTDAEIATTQLRLFLENGFDTASEVRLTENDIVVDAGEVFTNNEGPIFTVVAPFTDDGYRARFGIALKSSGNYTIAPSFSEVLIRPHFVSNQDGKIAYFINLSTNIKAADEETGRFSFSVSD